jgi:C4-dicarboxylate-specific signal transduction histidine kinase
MRVGGEGGDALQVLREVLRTLPLAAALFAFDAVVAAPSKWIRLSAVDRIDSVAILVEDSGAGVEAQFDDEVFRPFFTTKPLGAATGLGLTISRSIIESHGGTLTLDRRAPHTRFVVVLPR